MGQKYSFVPQKCRCESRCNGNGQTDIKCKGRCNINYEEGRSSTEDSAFSKLEQMLKEKAGIEKINLDILKTLNLYDKNGYYNIAGELSSVAELDGETA